MRFPFTEEELFKAYRVSHSDARARKMARETIDGARATSQALEKSSFPSVEKGTTPLIGMALSPDLLINLSMQSKEMNERVMAYLGAAMDDPRFQTLWNARRAELSVERSDESSERKDDLLKLDE